MENDFGNEKGNLQIGKMILALILLVIILYTAVEILGGMEKYKNSERNYDEIANQAITSKENVGGKTSYTKNRSAPITVDFEAIRSRKEGKSVVGWLYVEAVEISYPILHGSSNQQYLRTNLDGVYDICGSIFMDAENSSDFSDPNTIIFGHNMADGSMFGKLKEISLEGALNNSPYVWIITEEQDYCYKIFSVQVAETTNECYTLFGERGTKFEEFLKRMHQNSIEDTGEFSFTKTDSILTLSTCNGSNTSSRYVIQAIKIN